MDAISRDPLLAEHQIAPCVFDLRHRFTPVSIRDQMVRARMFIDRACLAGLVDPHDRNLLVVGAGATGASAAKWAAARKVTTKLVDELKTPFRRQQGVSTRWVSPTMYDWPASHWRDEALPWRDDAMPFSWRVGGQEASELALNWSHALADGEGLTFEPLTEFLYALPTIEPTPWSVAALKTLDAPGTPTRLERFGLILICTGVEDDGPCDEGNCLCVDGEYVYRCFRFWQEDDYAAPNAGVRDADARVLISGGGDSGLQDFIRILLAPAERSDRPGTPRDLLHDVEESGIANWPQRLLRIQTAEDQANRRWAWSTTKSEDHAILDQLHTTYRQVVDTIPEPAWGHIRTRFADRITSRVPITFAHRCSHFGRCYGLNRFLALLLIRFLSERDRRRGAAAKQLRYLPGYQLTGLAPADDHAQRCDDPVACHGKEHRAVLTGGGCLTDAKRAARRRNDQFNVVIVRHGPGDVCGKPRRPAPPPIRQVLPYFVEP